MRFTANLPNGSVSVLATNRADATEFLSQYYARFSDLRYAPTLYAHIADKVTVRDEDGSDETMINACFNRIAHWGEFAGDFESAWIVTFPRRADGWLEYAVTINYRGTSMFIGAIQRTDGAEIEFHS